MLLSPILYNGGIISRIQKSVSNTENFNPCNQYHNIVLHKAGYSNANPHNATAYILHPKSVWFLPIIKRFFRSFSGFQAFENLTEDGAFTQYVLTRV